jgi:putative (di)nucleoside polyphosphate hydrolase
LRELAEEIGTDKAEIVAKSSRWFSYDLPGQRVGKVWKGKYRGQKQRWFALRFTGGDGDIDLNASEHPEFNDWKWVDIDDLVRLIVPFKRAIYKEIVAEFHHLAGPPAPTTG